MTNNGLNIDLKNRIHGDKLKYKKGCLDLTIYQ